MAEHYETVILGGGLSGTAAGLASGGDLPRRASGQTTVRAVCLTTPLRLDGRLDEEL